MARIQPIVAFAAPSGTGKTTLIEGVLRALTARGYRVGVVKHDAHRLELDKPGKDTWRFRRAGAHRAVIAGDTQLAVFSAVDGELSIGGVVDRCLPDVDLVIAEGFRRSGLPTLRVQRVAHKPGHRWTEPTHVIAWVSDARPEVDVPVLPLDQPSVVADFIEDRYLGGGNEPRRRVSLVLPIADSDAAHAAAGIARRLRPLFGDSILAVHAPGVTPPPGVRAIGDVRPDTGPLGALLTGLAAADTPDVMLLGSRHTDIEPRFVDALLAAAPRAADVITTVTGDLRDPLLALYGHRCLHAIRAALLSGEARMDGWWGQVRVHRIPAATWRTWPGADCTGLDPS